MKHMENKGLTVLRKLCNNDVNFMLEMINIFLQSTPKSILKIKTGIRDADLEQVGNYAHKLKSSIQIIGDPSLHSLLISIENLAKEGDPNKQLLKAGMELENKVEVLYTYLRDKLENPDSLV